MLSSRKPDIRGDRETSFIAVVTHSGNRADGFHLATSTFKQWSVRCLISQRQLACEPRQTAGPLEGSGSRTRCCKCTGRTLQPYLTSSRLGQSSSNSAGILATCKLRCTTSQCCTSLCCRGRMQANCVQVSAPCLLLDNMMGLTRM